MNWSFLDEDTAKAIWEEAYRRYFEEDEPLQDAFVTAINKHGFTEDSDT